MDYVKIEKHFVDYIINLVGPNEDYDKQREEKFKNIKKIIENSFENEQDLHPHIFCFGSYPLKTYLQDSDLDITIMFEDKTNESIISNYSYEFLNK